MQIGQLTYAVKDGRMSLACDALALLGPHLAIASISGPQTAVKGFVGALTSNNLKPEFSATEVKFANGDESAYGIKRFEHKYRVHQVKLDRWTGHAVVYVSLHTLMLNDSDEALWRLLTSEAFTTPVLRAWVPWIRRQLENAGMLRPCMNFQVNAAHMTATQADVDQIVSSGLATGQIRIEEE